MAGLLQSGDDFAGVASSSVLALMKKSRRRRADRDSFVCNSFSRSAIHLFATAGPAPRSLSGIVAKTSSISSGSENAFETPPVLIDQTCQSSFGRKCLAGAAINYQSRNVSVRQRGCEASECAAPPDIMKLASSETVDQMLVLLPTRANKRRRREQRHRTRLRQRRHGK